MRYFRILEVRLLLLHRHLQPPHRKLYRHLGLGLYSPPQSFHRLPVLINLRPLLLFRRQKQSFFPDPSCANASTVGKANYAL